MMVCLIWTNTAIRSCSLPGSGVVSFPLSRISRMERRMTLSKEEGPHGRWGVLRIGFIYSEGAVIIYRRTMDNRKSLDRGMKMMVPRIAGYGKFFFIKRIIIFPILLILLFHIPSFSSYDIPHLPHNTIYLYNFQTNETNRITSIYKYNSIRYFNDKYILYSDEERMLILYNISNGKREQIKGIKDPIAPSMKDDYILYTDVPYKNNSYFNIHLYNINDKTNIQITHNPGRKYGQFIGNNIIWTDFEQLMMFQYNIDNKTILEYNISYPPLFFSICKNNVIWKEDFIYYTVVYQYNIDTRIKKMILNVSGNIDDIHHFNDFLIFSRYNNSNNHLEHSENDPIIIYDLSKNEIITLNISYTYPFIYKGYIYYKQYNQDYSYIYSYNIYEKETHLIYKIDLYINDFYMSDKYLCYSVPNDNDDPHPHSIFYFVILPLIIIFLFGIGIIFFRIIKKIRYSTHFYEGKKRLPILDGKGKLNNSTTWIKNYPNNR